MATTRVLELLLERVQIDKEKTDRKGKKKRIVIATLVWPRPRIAERVTAKTVDFVNNEADLTKSTWTEKILFKERVLGTFGMQIAVTDPVNESQAAEFFAFLGAGLFKLAGTEGKKMMPTPFEGGLVKLPFEYLAKLIAAAAKKEPKIPNVGMIDLDAIKVWGEKQKNARIEIPLKAAFPIYRMARSKRGKGTRGKRQLVVKEGQVNGSVIVSGKLYAKG